MEITIFRGDIYANNWKFRDFRKIIESHHIVQNNSNEYIDDEHDDVYKFSLKFTNDETNELLLILKELKSSLVGNLSNVIEVTNNINRAINYLGDYLKNGANHVYTDSDDQVWDFSTDNTDFHSLLEFLNPPDGTDWEVAISIVEDMDNTYDDNAAEPSEAVEMTTNNNSVDEYTPMTLSEAIEHLEEMLTDSNHDFGCESCKREHEQLLGWLKDLQSAKQFLSFAADDLEHIGTNCCYEDCDRECESCPLISTYGEWRYKKEVNDLLRRIK